jgi:hypothetical protein
MRASKLIRVGAVAAACVIAHQGPAAAHAVCGDRVFPATLTMDDPGVGDEFTFPTITYLPIPASNGNPAGHSIDYGYEWDKTITRDLGVAINGDYFTQKAAGQNLNGWNNTTVTLKDELPCLESHEFMASVSVARQFAKTGSAQLITSGTFPAVSSTTPNLYAGKGLGDLPIGYLRPLAVTTQLGRQLSDLPNASPDQWNYAFSVQYSMPYLQQNVKDLDLPEFFTRLVPLVELSYSTPHNSPTTGTISPGILYEADTWQFGIEASIPATSASRTAQGNGIIAQFHLFLDDLLPNSLGKPLIDADLWHL